MELIKHPTTADEALVYFWQHYVTGEAWMNPTTKRTTFKDSQPRDKVGRFTKVKAELPKVRQVPVYDYLQGNYYINL